MTDLSPAAQSLVALMHHHMVDRERAGRLSTESGFDAFADEDCARSMRIQQEADLARFMKDADPDDIMAALRFWGPTASAQYLHKSGPFNEIPEHNSLFRAILKMEEPGLNAATLDQRIAALDGLHRQNPHGLIGARFRLALQQVLDKTFLTPDDIPADDVEEDPRLLFTLSHASINSRDPDENCYETAFRFFDAVLDEYESNQGQLNLEQTLRLAGYLAVASRKLVHEDNLFLGRAYDKTPTDLHALFQNQIDYWNAAGPDFDDIAEGLRTQQARIDAHRDQSPLFHDPVPFAEAYYDQRLADRHKLAASFPPPAGFEPFFDENKRYARRLNAGIEPVGRAPT